MYLLKRDNEIVDQSEFPIEYSEQAGGWKVNNVIYGDWTNRCIVTVSDDQKADEVRKERNKLLSDCDWTQGKDIADAVSFPWAQYRQELRDLPSQEGFPWDVIYPTKPAV